MSISWEELKNELLQDESIKLDFEAEELKVNIIKELLFYLEKNKLTQKQCAKKLGIKQQALSRFIKGDINPRFDFIAKILILLGEDICSYIPEKVCKIISFEKRENTIDNRTILKEYSYKKIVLQGA